MCLELDFVYGDYSEHVVVVCVDVCGCCVHACHGDVVVPKIMCVVCMSWLCRVEWIGQM